MPRQKRGEILDRYAGLIAFLNIHLDKKNWHEATHQVIDAYAERPRNGERPVAIAIDRDLEIQEAINIQKKLRVLFEHDRPRAFATLDAMQAIWFVAAALMQEHDGLRRCEPCGDCFLPRQGQKTCGKSECVRDGQNAARRRARAAVKQSRRLERTAR